MVQPSTVDTRARRKLARWMSQAPHERGQTSIAKAVGVAQPTVRDWLLRVSRPRDAIRTLLELHTDGAVPADDWKTPEERKALRAALKRAAKANQERRLAAP